VYKSEINVKAVRLAINCRVDKLKVAEIREVEIKISTVTIITIRRTTNKPTSILNKKTQRGKLMLPKNY
jgi:hypothetical protein